MDLITGPGLAFAGCVTGVRVVRSSNLLGSRRHLVSRSPPDLALGLVKLLCPHLLQQGQFSQVRQRRVAPGRLNLVQQVKTIAANLEG